MGVVKHILASEGAGHRHAVFFGEFRQRPVGPGGPRRTAENDHRPLGLPQQFAKPSHGVGRRRGDRAHRLLKIRGGHLVPEHILGQFHHHRPRAVGNRHAPGIEQLPGNGLGALNPQHRLGDAAIDPTVIQFLKRLAPPLMARILADEQQHRRGILKRGVDADHGIGGAGPPGDKTNPRLAAQLAAGLGHISGPAFLATRYQPDAPAVMIKSVQRAQVTFAGDAERVGHPVGRQAVHQHPAAAAFAGFGRWHQNGG